MAWSCCPVPPSLKVETASLSLHIYSMVDDREKTPDTPDVAANDSATPIAPDQSEEERGGPKGPEPTRYGDWEQKGRCTDF